MNQFEICTHSLRLCVFGALQRFDFNVCVVCMRSGHTETCKPSQSISRTLELLLEPAANSLFVDRPYNRSHRFTFSGIEEFKKKKKLELITAI